MNRKCLNRICPICKGTSGKILTHIYMVLGDGMEIPDEYDVVSCDNCGFTFADVGANQDAYNYYYANDNCYSCDSDIKEEGESASVKHIVKFLQSYVKKNESILDIGCGAGDVLKGLKRTGYTNLTGMDPSQESLQRLYEEGIKGINKNVFDYIENTEVRYDVVISTCVMEHILDLNTFLDMVVQYMKPNGKFYIVVPAVEGFEKYYQAKPNYFNHEHINYFSQISLENLMLMHNMCSMTEKNGQYYKIADDHGKQDLMFQNIYEINKNEINKIRYDSSSEDSINHYISMDNEVEKKIDVLIEKLEKEGKSCIVWGAGSLAMSLMVSKNLAKHIDGFVDNNVTKVGKNIKGKEIYFPDILREEKYKDHLILILCMRYSDSILKQIHEMGIQNEVMVY